MPDCFCRKGLEFKEKGQKEQVWRALLSILYHYSIYISVSSLNQSLYGFSGNIPDVIC